MAHLLVVDDDRVLLEAMEEILSSFGHAVCAVTSGEAALSAIEANPPELIIADVIMPGMSGIDLLKAVRSHPDWGHIPFVFISAAASPKTHEQLEAMGKEAFLAKPFDAEDLREAVIQRLTN
jgi:CheY-like chemotaxis protein